MYKEFVALLLELALNPAITLQKTLDPLLPALDLQYVIAKNCSICYFGNCVHLILDMSGLPR